jgi:hypothetical protein
VRKNTNVNKMGKLAFALFVRSVCSIRGVNTSFDEDESVALHKRYVSLTELLPVLFSTSRSG